MTDIPYPKWHEPEEPIVKSAIEGNLSILMQLLLDGVSIETRGKIW